VILRPLTALLSEEPAVRETFSGAGTSPGGALVVPEAARAFVVAGLAVESRGPLLVGTPTSAEAERLVHDLGVFLGPEEVELFPAWETLPFERVSPSAEAMGRRLRVLWRLRGGGRLVVVAPVRALAQRLVPGADEVEPVVVRRGGTVDRDELIDRLVALGYRREYQVEHRGEVAVRGSIVDVYPSTADVPYRIDFLGDEVERLTEFDPTDQRSVRAVERLEVFPCRELLPTAQVRAAAERLVTRHPWARAEWERLATGQCFDGMESLLPFLAEEELLVPDLLRPNARVLLVEPRRMRDRAAELLADEAALVQALATTWGLDLAEDGRAAKLARLHLGFDRVLERTRAELTMLVSAPEGPDQAVVEARAFEAPGADPAQVALRLGALAEEGYRVVVAADGAGSAQRMGEALAAEGVPAEVVPSDGRGAAGADGARLSLDRPGVHVVVAPLERGFVLPRLRLAVVAEPDLTGRRRPHRRARARPRATTGFFDDLAVGDYVVHHHHGVARYGGIVRRSTDGAERDYLLLEYRGGDRLYVPCDQIDLVTPYAGGETPTLHRLGGSDWQRTTARVRAAVREIADELVALYRKRHATAGHAFSPDTPWQRELEEAFPYAETPDQRKAIEDVKADMEAPSPMDRLVCGDVGFGKTEVAIRAVFKAVQDGKQAAVLVPTTLLAQQHHQTISERFARFPVRVEVLSRFLTPAQARPVLEGLADGSVDVVIGTHRLLSPDVRFKDLGLLVVDEEQRFGVVHKEAIKALATGVDVLTLTATPIPRTLEMSLTGIRDLTLLNTPPADRQPILTYVGDYDERAVSEAIRRELLREGQVFFVHNRVADIDRVAERLRALVPEARIAVAHGQMDEGTLEKVVLDFWQGAYDVLVCTTIIESGIDMPTVNTLVVDRADTLGLGQLHQLRGRVGRAGQRAYAYLFVPPDRTLSEAAYERLRTIGENTELGSGFKIAMRDLEIRGAGNLLGTDQSGHIAAVGYDLYVRLVSEAVAEAKGEPASPPAEVKLDLPVDAHLPVDYVEREDLRLEAYRRLASVRSPEEVEDTAAEWQDRYGPPPPPAAALLRVARLRAECVRTGVREVTVTSPRPTGPHPGRFVARLAPVRLRPSEQVRLRRLWPGAVLKEDLGQLVGPLPSGCDPVERLVELLQDLIRDAPASAGARTPSDDGAQPARSAAGRLGAPGAAGSSAPRRAAAAR
jgi:transcription-repair coupling factor (superfamily II helicase)